MDTSVVKFQWSRVPRVSFNKRPHSTCDSRSQKECEYENPTAHFHAPVHPLTCIPFLAKHSLSFLLNDAHLPGLTNPKQLAIHLGLISCLGKLKRSHLWQTGHQFYIIASTQWWSIPLLSTAMLSSTQSPPQQSNALVKSSISLEDAFFFFLSSEILMLIHVRRCHSKTWAKRSIS